MKKLILLFLIFSILTFGLGYYLGYKHNVDYPEQKIMKKLYTMQKKVKDTAKLLEALQKVGEGLKEK